jgi:hypothetical protein
MSATQPRMAAVITTAGGLEVAIQFAEKALLAAPDQPTQRICLTALTDLVNRRSPGQVKRMERAKRIA